MGVNLLASRRRLIMARRPHTETGSGRIVTFDHGVAYPLEACTVGIDLTQAGSGTPGADNVRPVTLWTGAHIYVSPTEHEEDGTVYPISWETAAGTLAAGILDVNAGTLTKTWEGILFNSGNTSRWGLTAQGTLSCIVDNAYSTAAADTESVVASYIPAAGRSGLYTGDTTNGICLYNGNRIWLRFPGCTTLEAWTAYVAEHPLTVAFRLATPQVYQLTATEIQALSGKNNIWADTGDISITYWVY